MKKRIYKFFLFTSITLLIFNCSKGDEDFSNNDRDVKEEVPEEEETFNYTSANKYNLNIIYFIPKGSEKRVDAHRRISEILLQGQEFYKKNMMHYGFGEKTFSMLTDNVKKRVKITFLEGSQNESAYPYNGGGNIMKGEIENYFKNKSLKIESDHYLVITPVGDPKNNDTPYYGLGKWCFATDYDDMDIKHLGGNSDSSTLATTYIGGLLHELGHGLNLPHNKEKVSELADIKYGTCLMGSGNYTYGSKPTFMSEASCAILNNNQIFDNINKKYYTGATGSIEDLKATYEQGNFIISGKIEANVAVNNISIYHDPADDNANYDAVSWSTKVATDNTFSISMPIAELHKKGDIPYVLRLLLNHVSGDITNVSYSYKFLNGEPVIDFGTKNYKSRDKWTIDSFSSEEYNALAIEAIDNNKDTFWHSCWTGTCSSASYPHFVTIDTHENITVEGFSFLQRKTLSRSIKDIEIHVSDDNKTYRKLGSYTLENINTTQNFKATASFRYFKFKAISAYDKDRFAALAEVYCF
ncbi:discoidin domain-containing protein [uncultured Polaribacter sp.]|uniref:discoidin domain-containing protein n=1 Tax=uncultured Polaribacter sp. TaxID=174711 RepID=UPI0026166A5F|nr:discoidin domain-containing protein [uncultured Polaribacter sp.]